MRSSSVESVVGVPGGRVIDVVDVLDGVTGGGTTRIVVVGCINVVVVVEGACDVGGVVTVMVVASVVDTVTVGRVVVVGVDGSLLFVVVVKTGGTVEGVGPIVVVVAFGVVSFGVVVVGTTEVDVNVVVVVSDGTSVVDTERVVVGQC